MADTSIEWTDKVWNPVTGCAKVSAGCAHCYAERMFGRNLPGMKGQKFSEVRCHDDRLEAPLHWRKPRRVFVNSMSDLFHEDVPCEFIDKVFAVMALCPQHTFQVLTKRPERMLEYFTADRDELIADKVVFDAYGPLAQYLRKVSTWIPDEHDETDGGHRVSAPGYWDWHVSLPLPNVWLGVSVENQQAADERIPLLLDTPAAVRFVSCEPLLGPVDLAHIDWVAELGRIYTRESQKATEYSAMFADMAKAVRGCEWEEGRAWRNALTGAWFDGWDGDDNPEPLHHTIDWVIVGGESGPNARPMHPDWARSLRDQCRDAGVPFFFKQWGEWAPESKVGYHERTAFCRYGEFHVGDGEWIESCLCAEGADDAQMYRVGKKIAGRLLDGREWNEFPEVCQ